MEQMVRLKYDTDAAARVQGEHTGNQYTVPKGNNFPLPTTAEKIGEQFNVSTWIFGVHTPGYFRP